MNENGNDNAMVDTEWDVDLSDFTDSEADQPTEEVDDAETPVDESTTDEAAETAAETENPEQPEQTEPEVANPEPEMFTLKHLDETLTVDRAKITELAQQGLDYERIRTMRDDYKAKLDDLQKFKDSNSETLELIQEIANASGTSVEALCDTIRANQYIAKGMSEDAANERVAREKAERKLQAVQSKQNERTKQEQAQAEMEQRRDQDIKAFFAKYPNTDPKDIPKAVWDAVNSGETLVSAYQAYQAKQIAAENERLKAQIAAAAQNEKNRQKTIGTQKTGGQETAKDAFFEGFD